MSHGECFAHETCYGFLVGVRRSHQQRQKACEKSAVVEYLCPEGANLRPRRLALNAEVSLPKSHGKFLQ